MRRQAVWGRIALVALVALAGFAAVHRAGAQQPSLRIGFVGYLATGPNYDFGAVAGAQLAVDQINQAGGLVAPDGTTYRLELAIESATDPATARAAIQSLLDRDVIAVLGPDAVEQTLPNLDLAAGAQVPQLTSAMADAITAQSASNFVFRVRAPDRARAQALAHYLVDEVGYRRIGVAHTGSVYGNAATVAFTNILAGFGVQPVVETQHDAADLNMAGDAQALAASAPEVMAFWGDPFQAALLLRELRARGWQGAFAYSDLGPTFWSLLTAGEIGGVLGPLTWVYTLPEAASREFLADYVQAYGVVPNERSAAYYDGVKLLAAAIRAAGPEPVAIRDYLLNVPDFLAVQGRLAPARFGNGETSDNTVIVEVDRNTLVPRLLARYRGPVCVDGCTAPAVAAAPSETPTDTPESMLEPTGAPSSTPTPATTTPMTLEATPTATETFTPTWTPSATLPAPVVTPTASWTPVPLPNTPSATPTFPPTATVTPTLGPSPTPSDTPTPTLTPTPEPVFVQSGEVNMNLRDGPGLDYSAVESLPQATRVEAVGRNADSTWLRIQYQGREYWLAGWLVEVAQGDVETLPILAPWGATPTPGPTPARVPILAIMYRLDDAESMDLVRVLLELEPEYRDRVRIVYVNVDRVNDFGLYSRIYEGVTPAIGLIDSTNVLRQVFTGTVTEDDLRARLDVLAGQ